MDAHTCGCCRQPGLVLTTIGDLTRAACVDCDTARCPRCRANVTVRNARFCTACGESMRMDPRGSLTVSDINWLEARATS